VHLKGHGIDHCTKTKANLLGAVQCHCHITKVAPLRLHRTPDYNSSDGSLAVLLAVAIRDINDFLRPAGDNFVDSNKQHAKYALILEKSARQPSLNKRKLTAFNFGIRHGHAPTPPRAALRHAGQTIG